MNIASRDPFSGEAHPQRCHYRCAKPDDRSADLRWHANSGGRPEEKDGRRCLHGAP